MTQFFAMGGYALYVWPAWGLATILLVGLLAATLKGLRDREAEWALVRQVKETAPQRQRHHGGAA